jgi:hypothetical protein
MSNPGGTHANFRDPVGLLTRMLRSGDRAARGVLIRELLGVVLLPLDRVLAGAERRRLAAAPDVMRPLVFIVGAPRSGTTLIYQALARYLPVTYFTNLSAMFPHAPLTASRLFLRNSSPTQPTFHNYYGNTVGMAGPNDGFHVWNRWLGTDRYRAPESLPDDVIADMRRFFSAWTATFDRPLLNKNNRNTDCIRLLARVFPEAYFVVVRRDPVYVAQSLVIARQHVQGDKGRRWGLRSLDQEPGTEALGYIDSVCRQVVDIERRLTADCQAVSAARIIEVSYEAFCERPADAIGAVARRVWGTSADPVKASRQLDPVGQSTNVPRLSSEELARIQQQLEALEGDEHAAGRSG